MSCQETAGAVGAEPGATYWPSLRPCEQEVLGNLPRNPWGLPTMRPLGCQTPCYRHRVTSVHTSSTCHLHGQHRVTLAHTSTRCHLCWPQILPYKASAEAAAGYLWSLTHMWSPGTASTSKPVRFSPYETQTQELLVQSRLCMAPPASSLSGSQHTWI